MSLHLIRKRAGIVAGLVILGVAISCAATMPWFRADKPSAPSPPSVIQVHPADVPPSFPAEPAQRRSVETEDPLYNFRKNILPQVAARNPESKAPSVSVPDSADPASRSPVDAAGYPQRYAPADESFLTIEDPPKARALGFPQITNTRENVVHQNNWAILQAWLS